MSTGLASLLRQRATRFVLVGLGANLLLFLLAYLFSRMGMPAFAAGATAYAIAFLAAYRAQHEWTFGGAHAHRRAFPRYLLAQIGCAVVSGSVGHVSVAVFDASPFWMSAALTAAAGVTSYLLSSRWVFADSAR